MQFSLYQQKRPERLWRQYQVPTDQLAKTAREEANVTAMTICTEMTETFLLQLLILLYSFLFIHVFLENI